MASSARQMDSLGQVALSHMQADARGLSQGAVLRFQREQLRQAQYGLVDAARSWEVEGPGSNSWRASFQSASATRGDSAPVAPLPTRPAIFDEYVQVEAAALLAVLKSTVAKAGLTGSVALSTATRDDGSIVVEWIMADRRLTFSIELDRSESHWSYAKRNGDYACGELASAPLSAVVSAFMDRELAAG